MVDLGKCSLCRTELPGAEIVMLRGRPYCLGCLPGCVARALPSTGSLMYYELDVQTQRRQTAQVLRAVACWSRELRVRALQARGAHVGVRR